LNNQPFKYAGQFVDFMNIYLMGMAKKYPDYVPELKSCTQSVETRNFLSTVAGRDVKN